MPPETVRPAEKTDKASSPEDIKDLSSSLFPPELDKSLSMRERPTIAEFNRTLEDAIATLVETTSASKNEQEEAKRVITAYTETCLEEITEDAQNIKMSYEEFLALREGIGNAASVLQNEWGQDLEERFLSSIRVGFDSVQSEDDLKASLTEIQDNGDLNHMDAVSFYLKLYELKGVLTEKGVEAAQVYFDLKHIEDQDRFSKKKDIFHVLHEVVQDMGRYHPDAQNMVNILNENDPKGDCKARLEYAFCRLQNSFGAQYPLKVQILGGHVRLLMEVDGQLYALEGDVLPVDNLKGSIVVDPAERYFVDLYLGNYLEGDFEKESSDQYASSVQDRQGPNTNILGSPKLRPKYHLIPFNGGTTEETDWSRKTYKEKPLIEKPYFSQIEENWPGRFTETIKQIKENPKDLDAHYRLIYGLADLPEGEVLDIVLGIALFKLRQQIDPEDGRELINFGLTAEAYGYYDIAIYALEQNYARLKTMNRDHQIATLWNLYIDYQHIDQEEQAVQYLREFKSLVSHLGDTEWPVLMSFDGNKVDLKQEASKAFDRYLKEPEKK